MTMNLKDEDINFEDGVKLDEVHDAMYLGNELNDKAE